MTNETNAQFLSGSDALSSNWTHVGSVHSAYKRSILVACTSSHKNGRALSYTLAGDATTLKFVTMFLNSVLHPRKRFAADAFSTKCIVRSVLCLAFAWTRLYSWWESVEPLKKFVQYRFAKRSYFYINQLL